VKPELPVAVLTVLALALWVPFIATGHDSSLVGVLGLFCYRLTAVTGLLLLWRRKPVHGRHAARERRLGLAAAGLALALVPAALVVPAATGTTHASRPAVIGRRVIGHSVRGRPITAWHVGEPGRRKVVLIAVMHGNEPAARRILTDLRDGPPVHDLNLWVVPVYNPDGLAAVPARTPTGSTSTATIRTSGSGRVAGTSRDPGPHPDRRPGR
jgi:Zinc carboxypeptidase